jgi:hypothetical protein
LECKQTTIVSGQNTSSGAVFNHKGAIDRLKIAAACEELKFDVKIKQISGRYLNQNSGKYSIEYNQLSQFINELPQYLVFLMFSTFLYWVFYGYLTCEISKVPRKINRKHSTQLTSHRGCQFYRDKPKILEVVKEAQEELTRKKDTG